MSADPLLPEEEREQIAKEARERDEDPAEYARDLLAKGREYDALSRSRDRLIDEIRRVRSGNKEVVEIRLPSELDDDTKDPLLDDILRPYVENPPYGWDELEQKDRHNIAQYALHRERQGADTNEISHEVENLIGLAAFNIDKPLSDSRLEDFGEPENRRGRSLDRFLRFIGNHPQV